MTQALLDAIANGMVSSATDIHKYMRCTLLAHTQDYQVRFSRCLVRVQLLYARQYRLYQVFGLQG